MWPCNGSLERGSISNSGYSTVYCSTIRHRGNQELELSQQLIKRCISNSRFLIHLSASYCDHRQKVLLDTVCSQKISTYSWIFRSIFIPIGKKNLKKSKKFEKKVVKKNRPFIVGRFLLQQTKYILPGKNCLFGPSAGSFHIRTQEYEEAERCDTFVRICDHGTLVV